jgi:hypothetical protein
MSIRENSSKIVALCNERLAALKKFVTTKTQMTINGQLMKLSDVIAVYQTALDARSTAATQRVAYEHALKAREQADSARLTTDAGLEIWVLSQFGVGSQTASEFGFSPRKVGVKSAQTKADAVAKNLSTRKARMTMGKRQKADIKGTVVVPTAPAAPVSSAPVATPAPIAPVVTPALNGAAVTNGTAGH